MTIDPAVSSVREYFCDLQDRICAALVEVEAAASSPTVFDARVLPGERGGESRPRVLSDGAAIEKAAVNFSHTAGERLTAAATEQRSDLAGRSYEAVSISLIVHPRNPYAPTTHANLRLFFAYAEGREPVWWFGGGFDLTPYYGFEEDAVHWHRTAEKACAPFGENIYPRLKKACDEYFFLPHRGEPRGIGGLFFDDLNDLGDGFETCFALVRSVGDHFLPAYLPILERRLGMAYDERQRDFQLYRRGRYAEFNLVYDRGTRHGLQAGGRIESILASLPPLVRWQYDFSPESGSPEEELYSKFLRPRDWLE